jgi:hypothetical protein
VDLAVQVERDGDALAVDEQVKKDVVGGDENGLVRLAASRPRSPSAPPEKHRHTGVRMSHPR